MTRRKRNPYHGISGRKEFLWDLEHPAAFFADSWDGLRGRNGLDPGIRFIGLAMLGVGALQIVGGAVALLFGYGIL